MNYRRSLRMSVLFFFLMIRRPPRSTQSRSSAASDVYKRQVGIATQRIKVPGVPCSIGPCGRSRRAPIRQRPTPVSYTHLRAHETPEHLVCRLLLEKKKKTTKKVHNHTKVETVKDTHADNE